MSQGCNGIAVTEIEPGTDEPGPGESRVGYWPDRNLKAITAHDLVQSYEGIGV